MDYELNEINLRTVSDPREFVEECITNYDSKIEQTADLIIRNYKKSPIVLLSGPSGSGKTTTSMKIAEVLNRKGIGTHYVGMDDYFNTINPETTPRTPEGDYDLESPLCLDFNLLNKHFDALDRGERIFVPKYEFSRQMRVLEPSKSIKLGKDEIVIFEGIHALNDMITSKHPDAFKLYISAQSNIVFNGTPVYKRTWFRLIRRTVRDNNFRGTDPQKTIEMWANVRRGEINYISPFKSKADFQFDTAFPFEPALFNTTATKLFRDIPDGIGRYEELRSVLPAIQLFGHIDEELIPEDAMIREFIGGGIYGQ